MPRINSPYSFQRLWVTPVGLGVLLVLMGVLIFNKPELFAYFVAGLFVLAGCVLVGVGWNMRRRITYRRIDEDWRSQDEHDTP
jgi:hypothetical protein